jgi:aconitase A
VDTSEQSIKVRKRVPIRAGVCPPDETTFDYVRQRTDEPFEPVLSDGDASYIEEYRFDVSKIEPLVAAPHSPDNRRNAHDCRDVKIDRVYIGCAMTTPTQGLTLFEHTQLNRGPVEGGCALPPTSSTVA